MNKEILKELALQAGGSHYPEVGGATLEKFAELLLEEVIFTIQNEPTNCAMTTFQLGIVECTIKKTVENIEQKFSIPHNYERENESSSSIRPSLRVSGH
jgi:hypothetical protein